MLFSSRLRVRIRFSVWFVSCYAHVFVRLQIVIVTRPIFSIHETLLRHDPSYPLVVPGIQLDTYGRRAFAVVGPTVWNALGNELRDPDLSNRQLRSPT